MEGGKIFLPCRRERAPEGFIIASSTFCTRSRNVLQASVVSVCGAASSKRTKSKDTRVYVYPCQSVSQTSSGRSSLHHFSVNTRSQSASRWMMCARRIRPLKAIRSKVGWTCRTYNRLTSSTSCDISLNCFRALGDKTQPRGDQAYFMLHWPAGQRSLCKCIGLTVRAVDVCNISFDPSVASIQTLDGLALSIASERPKWGQSISLSASFFFIWSAGRAWCAKKSIDSARLDSLAAAVSWREKWHASRLKRAAGMNISFFRGFPLPVMLPLARSSVNPRREMTSIGDSKTVFGTRRRVRTVSYVTCFTKL